MNRSQGIAAPLVAGIVIAAYCAPFSLWEQRPPQLDVALHVLAFASLVFVAGSVGLRGAKVFAGWCIAACLLEVGQWLLGGYRSIEWVDVAANAFGVLLGIAGLLMRSR